jgi:hypothetical protein
MSSKSSFGSGNGVIIVSMPGGPCHTFTVADFGSLGSMGLVSLPVNPSNAAEGG